MRLGDQSRYAHEPVGPDGYDGGETDAAVIGLIGTHHQRLRQGVDGSMGERRQAPTRRILRLSLANLILEIPPMKTTLLTCATLLAILTALPAAAQHDERCEPVPKAEWRPQAELERKLINQGWKISRVKITNGCYEV